MISKVLVVTAVLLTLAIVVALIRKYQTTRDIGFLWLGVAIVVWPRVEAAIHALFENRSFAHYTMGTSHLFLYVSTLVMGLMLQLVAILYLYKRKTAVPSSTESH